MKYQIRLLGITKLAFRKNINFNILYITVHSLLTS